LVYFDLRSIGYKFGYLKGWKLSIVILKEKSSFKVNVYEP